MVGALFLEEPSWHNLPAPVSPRITTDTDPHRPRKSPVSLARMLGRTMPTADEKLLAEVAGVEEAVHIEEYKPRRSSRPPRPRECQSRLDRPWRSPPPRGQGLAFRFALERLKSLEARLRSQADQSVFVMKSFQMNPARRVLLHSPRSLPGDERPSALRRTDLP